LPSSPPKVESPLYITLARRKYHREYFSALGDFEYNIGNKLYEFAIMSHHDFEKLKAKYNQLIELV